MLAEPMRSLISSPALDYSQGTEVRIYISGHQITTSVQPQEQCAIYYN